METSKKQLVLIGNGMAGMNTIEQVLKLTSQYEITVIGEEPYPNYNRIMLSYVLEGSKQVEDIILNEASWYDEQGIRLIKGIAAEAIDTEHKRVQTAQGAIPYDKLILATGSRSFMLPLPGADKQGVIGFRDIKDCEQMQAAARQYKKAAVIGGGLLGLEAAKGLMKLGMEVQVIHLMDRLMERQLDETAAAMLKEELESQGMRFLMPKQTAEILGDERVTGLRFADGEHIEADLIVMAVGIKPNIELAAASGIPTKRGILVDDYMETQSPDIYAVGECAEHNGMTYGLVAPLFEQGMVLAKRLAGAETKPYEPSILSTKLKISGVDVFSVGEYLDAPGTKAIKVQDDWERKYKKVLVRDQVIVGGVLFGDIQDSVMLTKWVKEAAPLTPEIRGMLTGATDQGCCGGQSATAAVASMTNEDIVCGCNGVTKGTIVDCVQNRGMSTVDEIKQATGATRSCGGCKPMVEQILQLVLGSEYNTKDQKQGICGCTTLNREEILEAIESKGLTHTKEVMHVLGWNEPEGCSKCRPALNYYLGMLHPHDHEDERESRFVNERLHANIQKDGTYSVVPRMYGGVTTPDDLRKIANVADKYQVGMVKVTGGQRIDLLGVKKEDLPKIWEDLDMPSGYAYAKSIRTVKTCVGSLFCRFGTQDSIHMGIDMEKKYERLNMPAKFKMAVNGCPRNCAEAGTKDVGIVGNDGGWEIYVGGNGGIKMRIADLLCKVKTDEELMAITSAFIQYYRETAKYAERTSDWVERVGLAAIQQAVVHDLEQRTALIERIELALNQVEEPWSEVNRSQMLQKTLYGTPEAEANTEAWSNVGAVEDFPLHLGKQVTCRGQELAIFRLEDGRFYALENRTPHRKGGTLAEGIVSGHYVYCPMRDLKISLLDGKVQEPDEGFVQTFKVQIKLGQVWIGECEPAASDTIRLGTN